MTVRVAVVDDYDVVVAGVARMLEPFDDRIDVIELVTNETIDDQVDIALFDAFAQGQVDQDDILPTMENPIVDRVVMYTWAFDGRLIRLARERRLGGYLAKSLPAEQLVEAIERIAEGEFVVSDPPPRRDAARKPGDWPGRAEGLTERESEVLALITQGHTTREVADTLYLSPNSIKTHTKSLYRKICVHNRAAAVVWGIDHGFRPDRSDRTQHGI